MNNLNQHSRSVNIEFLQAVSSLNLESIKKLLEDGADINFRDSETSTAIFAAYKQRSFDTVHFFLTHGADYRAVQTVGSSAGHSLLHVASKDGEEEMVKLLLTYNPDLGSKTPEGASPAHLAVLFKHKEVLEVLLAAGADINAEFGDPFHKKYFEQYTCCNEFGEKMTLLSHAVISNNEDMAELLINAGANVRQKSSTGKTLLMYAVERDNIKIIRPLLDKMADEDINCRDNFGATVVHFILHENKFLDCKFSAFQTLLNSLKVMILQELLKKDVDVNATVNNNPETLLINMAALRGCPEMVKLLLVKQTSKLSQPLYYSSINLHFPKSHTIYDSFWYFEHNVKKCAEQAVIDIVTKCELKMSVSEKEVKLLDNFAKRRDSRDFISECKSKASRYLQEQKSQIVVFGENKVSLFEVLNSRFGNLRKMIRSDDFLDKIYAFKSDCEFEYFYQLALSRLEFAKVRITLLEECNQVFVDMLTPFPLPYEILREIVDFIDNEDFKSLIQAFK